MNPPDVSICTCTYKRPTMLRRLLEAVQALQLPPELRVEVVVADNDAEGSARDAVAAFAETASFPVTYCQQPQKNIALTRNAALQRATGNYVAFIDDDEFPNPEWIVEALSACERYGASGVLGPVRPHFDTPPPSWVVKGRFCERPEPATGTTVHWTRSRTGNLVFRRSIIVGIEQPFDPAFGTGGEDIDFFRRMNANDRRFVWCNEAVVHESVPPSRCTRSYMLRRALLRGRNNLNFRGNRARLLLTSSVAVPVYTAILPFAALAGQHHFMNYCIRFCDHLGRILTVFHANPVNDRPV